MRKIIPKDIIISKVKEFKHMTISQYFHRNVHVLIT